MVAAQWGESRDSDARTGGGVAGRFRLLGGATEAPDPTPPEFGTAPWGYRRSEVDAWASWVAGIVAHGRNETVRADSAEATLKATLERLEQLERPGPRSDGGAPVPPATPALTADGEQTDTEAADPADDDPAEAGNIDPVGTADEKPDAPHPRTAGRLRFDPPTDLPRRTARGAAPPPETQEPKEPKDPADHELVRLQVVETTLREVMELLQNLAGRRTNSS